MVANFGAILQDRITFGPGISSDDGVLDVCIYAPRNLRDAARVMWRVLLNRFATDRAILYFRGRQIRVETTPACRFQADGELLGMTPFDIQVEPLAARLLVPRRA
jgi:diacylglycerol kinase family enzyme